MKKTEIKAYKLAYLSQDFDQMRFNYNKLQRYFVNLPLGDIVSVFEMYLHELITSQDFIDVVLGENVFDKQKFEQNLKEHLDYYVSNKQLPILYSLFLYSPDLLLKTIYHYSPKELLEQRDYPVINPINKLNLEFGKGIAKLIFYISNSESNYPDVYAGRSIPYNGNQQDFVFDYHLPLPFLFKEYYPTLGVEITDDYEKVKAEKYIYNLTLKNVHQFFDRHQTKFLDTIPKQVLKDLNHGKCLVIINSMHESFNISKYFYLICQVCETQLTRKGRLNLMFLTGNNHDLKSLENYINHKSTVYFSIKSTLLNFKYALFSNQVFKEIQIIGGSFFEDSMAFQAKLFFNNTSYDKRLNDFRSSSFIQHFICLNRVVKDFRLATSFLFYKNNLLSKTAISQNVVSDRTVLKSKFLKDFSMEEVEKFLKTLPYQTDSSTFTPNFWNLVPEEILKTTFLWVVTETLFGNKTDSQRFQFITEKTYKPIIFYMPFVIIGNYKALENLKNEGFKTFSKWWDESYDDEPNPTKRLNKVFEVLTHIATFTNVELIQLLEEMKEVLIFNHEHLIAKESGRKMTAKILNQLEITI